jgi:hypothetical protein
MKIENELKSRLPLILENARFAPSVHNTQPWKVHTENNCILVELDPDYLLKDGDPTGRETIISLGIFAEALSIAAEVEGFRTTAVKLQGKSLELQLQPSKGTPRSMDLIDLLKARCTDRSIYRPTTLSDDMTIAIEHSWKKGGVSIHVVDDAQIIQTVADLTSKGIRLALSNPNFRKELSQYLVVPWSSKQRGISVKSLYIPGILADMEPVLMRLGIGLDAEARLEKERWESASAIVAITAAGDMPEYWLETGRAYLRVSLTIEKQGLSQATSAATVEASNYHEDIEDILHTNQRLQSMIRVGLGKKERHYSPRIAVEEMLT